MTHEEWEPPPTPQPPTELESLHRKRLFDCVDCYFSHTNPSDLMQIHLQTFPGQEELSGEKQEIYLEKMRAAVELFEFLSRLERCYLNYRHYIQYAEK